MTITTDRRSVRQPESVRTRRLVLLTAAGVPTAALPTFFADDLLRGTPVMNGSARGTALVMVAAALSALLAGLYATVTHRSVRGHAMLVGALAYLTYNAMLLVYATPFNELSPVYVALLGFALWSLVSVLVDPLPQVDPGTRLPARGIAAFLGTVVVLNAAAWLSMELPDLTEDPPGFLEGTGLTINPIHAQDLAVWLPAVGVVAVLLWRRRPAGIFLAGAALVFWLLEAVGVAVDQWFGHRADPASDVATLGGSVMFGVLAVLTLVPLVAWLRAVPQQSVTGSRDAPAHARSPRTGP